MSRFGCIRDKFDERDYLMRPYLPVVKLPKVDIEDPNPLTLASVLRYRKRVLV